MSQSSLAKFPGQTWCGDGTWKSPLAVFGLPPERWLPCIAKDGSECLAAWVPPLKKWCLLRVDQAVIRNEVVDVPPLRVFDLPMPPVALVPNAA